MISKKFKKAKSKWVKGETKFITEKPDGTLIDVARKNDKLLKKIQLRRSAKEEALFYKKEKKLKPNNPIVKIERNEPNKKCKNIDCQRSRRRGSAYCGQDK